MSCSLSLRFLSLILSLLPGDQDEEQKSDGTSRSNVRRSRSGHRSHVPFPDGSGIGPAAASASSGTASSRSSTAPDSTTSSSVLGVVPIRAVWLPEFDLHLDAAFSRCSLTRPHMVGTGHHGCNWRVCPPREGNNGQLIMSF
jgi:hypothetical protein